MASRSYPLDEDERLFPSVTSNPYIFIVMSAFLMTALFLGKSSTSAQGPDAFSTFAFGWFFLSSVALVGVDTPSELSRAVGLKTPVTGYNFILATLGVGVGIIAFTFASQSASIVGSSTLSASLFSPFYNPYSAFPSQFSIATTMNSALEIVVYNFGVVALFEELYKIILLKNIANYLYGVRGWRSNRAIAAAILGSFSIWGTWHYFAWPDFNAASIVSSIIYGLAFYSGWAIADFIGVLNEPGKLILSAIVVMPAITSHGTWNTLQAIGGTGLTFAGQILLGFALIMTSVTSAWLIRSRFTSIGPDL